MNELKKTLLWNLVATALYGILYMVLLNSSKGNEGLGVAILMMFTVGLHVLACVVAAIVFFIIGKAPWASAFLLAALVVGLVGFSVCYGGALVGDL